MNDYPFSQTHHFAADMGLSAVLISAPLWVGAVNQWIALIGGVMGTALVAIRLWRAITRKEE